MERSPFPGDRGCVAGVDWADGACRENVHPVRPGEWPRWPRWSWRAGQDGWLWAKCICSGSCWATRPQVPAGSSLHGLWVPAAAPDRPHRRLRLRRRVRAQRPGKASLSRHPQDPPFPPLRRPHADPASPACCMPPMPPACPGICPDMRPDRCGRVEEHYELQPILTPHSPFGVCGVCRVLHE